MRSFLRNVLLLSMACFLVACNDQGSRVAEINKGAYGQRGVDNSWPVLKGDISASGLADDKITSNYVIVFDGSGSMSDSNCTSGGTRLSVAKAAVLDFMQSIPGNANLGLYVFEASDEGVWLSLNRHRVIVKSGVWASSRVPV